MKKKSKIVPWSGDRLDPGGLVCLTQGPRRANSQSQNLELGPGRSKSMREEKKKKTKMRRGICGLSIPTRVEGVYIRVSAAC